MTATASVQDDRFAIVGVDVIPMNLERVLEDQIVIIENGVMQSFRS